MAVDSLMEDLRGVRGKVSRRFASLQFLGTFVSQGRAFAERCVQTSISSSNPAWQREMGSGALLRIAERNLYLLHSYHTPLSKEFTQRTQRQTEAWTLERKFIELCESSQTSFENHNATFLD